MAMASDIPSFHEPGSEEDDARWQAYCAMLRRTAAAQEAEPEFDEQPQFEEEFEVAPDSADPDDADIGDSDLWPNVLAARTLESIGEAPFRRHARPPRRNRRLIVGALALTSGLILAAAMVPRRPAEPVVIYRDRPQGPVAAPAQPVAPAKSPPPRTEPRAELQAPLKNAAIARTASPPTRTQMAELDARAEASEAAPTTDRPSRRPARLEPQTQARKDALACWLTVMNNGHDTAYADGRVSVCDSAAPHPEQFLGQEPGAPNR
jgi:hypothetical protein